MSDNLEKEIALYEAERNRAWHSWFAARGDVSPSDKHTRIFDGGFRMAWELCRAQPAPQPAEQKPDVTQLVEVLTELCDEIDKHEIHAVISRTSISWFKRKARAALAAHHIEDNGNE